jgi:hypothetical protein
LVEAVAALGAGGGGVRLGAGLGVVSVLAGDAPHATRRAKLAGTGKRMKRRARRTDGLLDWGGEA